MAPNAGLTAQPFTTPGGNTVCSFILQPTPLTADNLQLASTAASHPGGPLQGRRPGHRPTSHLRRRAWNPVHPSPRPPRPKVVKV